MTGGLESLGGQGRVGAWEVPHGRPRTQGGGEAQKSGGEAQKSEGRPLTEGV